MLLLLLLLLLQFKLLPMPFLLAGSALLELFQGTVMSLCSLRRQLSCAG